MINGSLELSTATLAAVRPAGTPFFFHVHVPRTAGSALQRTWSDRGGCFIRLPLEQGDADAEILERRIHDALRSRQLVLIGGHYPFRLLKPALQEGDAVYTAVREPVERALSLFRYAVNMCQGKEIVNYPGGPAAREHWGSDWRSNVAGRGLDPDGFSLQEFLDAGFCEDGTFREYLGLEADASSLGAEMRDNGFTMVQGRLARRLLGSRPVNRTGSGALQATIADRRLLDSRLAEDRRAFDSITDAFPARREFSSLLRR